MKIIDNNIFDNTVFEGIPFNFKYVQKRPKHIYKVSNDIVTMYNFPAWIPYPEKETDHNLRELFLHDLCHAVNFYAKDKGSRILENDFGMDWDNVKRFKNPENVPMQWFEILSHLIDEYKISTLLHILNRDFNGKKLQSRKKVKDRIFDQTFGVWHGKNIYKGDKLTIDAIAKKKVHIAEAVDFWYDMGIKEIRKLIKSMVKELQPESKI